jgi:hypothetical protein
MVMQGNAARSADGKIDGVGRGRGGHETTEQRGGVESKKEIFLTPAELTHSQSHAAHYAPIGGTATIAWPITAKTADHAHSKRYESAFCITGCGC